LPVRNVCVLFFGFIFPFPIPISRDETEHLENMEQLYMQILTAVYDLHKLYTTG